jgi:hypothetical protein
MYVPIVVHVLMFVLLRLFILLSHCSFIFKSPQLITGCGLFRFE